MIAVDKIIIVDDHPLFRQALLGTLQGKLTETKWLEAPSLNELNQLLAHNPDSDLILLDLNIPGSHGFDTLINIRNQYPQIPVIVISAYEDADTIHKGMSFGASGFIPKSSPVEDIFAAIEQVLNGNLWIPNNLPPKTECVEYKNDDLAEKIASLTQQQFKILMMFNRGMLNKQIAYELNVSEATIKAHATAIFRKLDVRNRTQAVIAIGHLELQEEPL